jgi:hypothetical protein
MKFYIVKYINKILNKFGFNNLNPINTSIDPKIKLEPNKDQTTAENIKYYQQLIDFLLFLVLIIKINICFVIIKLARFISNSSEIHFGIIKKVFKYFKSTFNLGIIYNKYASPYIQGYYDADYTGDQLEAKSTSDYCLFIAGGLFIWKSKL